MTDPTDGAPTRPPSPLRSEFADDPDMAELVEMFVADMPEKIREIERLWAEGSSEELERIAHQIKGAAAGYGFPTLGEAAAAVERSLKGEEDDLDAVRRRVDELIDLCARAAG